MGIWNCKDTVSWLKKIKWSTEAPEVDTVIEEVKRSIRSAAKSVCFSVRIILLVDLLLQKFMQELSERDWKNHGAYFNDIFLSKRPTKWCFKMSDEAHF